MATEKQLKERWLTPKGKKVRQQIIEHIREINWWRFLEGFPFVDEVENLKDLRFIDLKNINLNKANLASTNLKGANLENANLGEADLRKANLSKVNLEKANLLKAILRQSNLWKADLSKADSRKADFSKAYLEEANLCEANLKKADFWRANLYGADLSGAKLNNAELENCCLNKAIMSKTDLTGVKIYGISAWDVKIDNTIMEDLIIREKPLITIGDLEIAQFIYLILNNKKISNLITTMRTKAVLILGSFDNQSKLVLNKIKEVLPKYNLIPIVFDFNPPLEQRDIETVKTLALLSKFVIVDLSKRSGQYFEVSNLVSDVSVPYVPIAVKGTKPSGMLKSLNIYDWWRKEYFYYPRKGWRNKLPELIENEIIPWADKINNKLLKNRDRED